MALKQSHRAAEGGANWTWGWKQSVEQTERKGGSLWASKKQLATRAVKSDERRPDRQEMKDQEAEEWGSIQQTHREARIYRTGSRVEQNQVSHSAQQSGIVCHTKNIIYRSRKSQHVGLHVLSVQKLNTTHLGQQNYQWTAPIQFHMSINFTVILKLYILIIIIILMRKYYTLVQDGRQEGVGAGNQEVSALLPAFETDITIDFLPNSRKIIIFFTFIIIVTVISCHIMKVSNVFHVLLTCIETFHIFSSDSQLLLFSIVTTSAPMLAPTITNTDMYVYIWMFFRLYRCLNQPLTDS